MTRIFGSWKTSQQRPEPHRNTSEVSLPWLNQRSIRAQHSTLHQIKWVQGTAPISWQVLNLVQFFFRTFPVKARLVSIYHCINSHIMIYYDISAKNIKWFHIVQHLSKIGPFCIILHHSAYLTYLSWEVLTGHGPRASAFLCSVGEPKHPRWAKMIIFKISTCFCTCFNMLKHLYQSLALHSVVF